MLFLGITAASYLTILLTRSWRYSGCFTLCRATPMRARKASFTARESGKASATSGDKTTTVLPSS